MVGFQMRVVLLLREHLAMSGDTFGCHNWELRKILGVVDKGQRLLLNILQYTG
jgi:hypothetical protein